jgi:O-antigen/teichoic acid export membrane protein/glycosyltransferase involved in cell wall biosynthesis
VTGAAAADESVAAHGARWISVALVIVGLCNYGYALLLTRLLDVAGYAVFAAGQGLIMWASTVAMVSVPWVLAQALARARSDVERNSAARFAKLASAGSGVIAAAIVGTVATAFAGSATALALALSTFAIFMGSAPKGWLQGHERMRALSALAVAENLLKNAAGVVLVMAAGLGDTGALAAFGIGGIVFLVWWPRTPRGTGRPWRAAVADRDLCRRAIGMAGAQVAVSLFVAIDVVLVALLPGDRALAASYQAGVALSRVPLFVAIAVAAAFFPSLSRRAAGGMIAARAVQMYAAVALPLTVVLATTPAPVLAAVLPPRYATVATLLKYTAVTSLAVGGISLLTAFFQAADDYSCVWWLAAGLAGYIGALLAGWRVGGITGLAAGGVLGAAAALALAGYRLVRRQGHQVLTRIPLVEPVVAAGVLVVLRPHTVLWLVAATLVALRACMRFLRPGSRPAREPRGAAPADPGAGDQPAASLLVDTVRRGTAPTAADAELHQALARRSATALLYPPAPPELHRHTGLSCFGVPVLPTGRLLARADRNENGVLVPAGTGWNGQGPLTGSGAAGTARRRLVKRVVDPMSRWRMAAARPGPAGSADVAAAGTAGRQVVISSFDGPDNPHYAGGGAAVVEMIAGRLAANFDVTVVTAAYRPGTEVRDGVRYRKLPVAWAGPRAGQLLYHVMLPLAARRIPHDLWIESFTPPFSTSFLPLFSRARVLGLAQSFHAQEMWNRYRLPFFLVEQLGLRFYREVVVLNSADRALVRNYSPSATVHVIPNGIPNRRLDERLLGHGEHILYLGRIGTWAKGLDLLLAAYSRSGLTMPLVVAGNGTRREERKFTALLAAADGDVRWVGHVTGQRKRQLLERSAFVTLPSRHEAFGLAALEGMSCGKPVLHFDLPSLRWMDGDVRVAPFDVSALAGTMRDLAGDEAARRELGRMAHAAAQRYGRDETADRYLALVQELLNAPRAGTGAESGPPCQ